MRYLLALKRIGISFFLLLLALLILPVLSVFSAEKITAPAAAFCCDGEPDEDAALLCDLLLEQGFEQESDEAALQKKISSGSYDCGVVFSGSLRTLLETNGPDGVLTFISTPTSLYDDLWRSSAASCFFSVYAPYITSDLLTDYGITQEEVISLFREKTAAPALFSFRISSEDGSPLETQSYRDSLFVFSFSLTAFLVLLYGIAVPVTGSFEALSLRMGTLPALRHVLLPELLLRFALFIPAAFLSCLCCGYPSLFPKLLLGSIACLLFSFAPAVLFRNRTGLSLFSAFLILISLVCYPLFTDLSLLVPFLARLRLFLPPLWFSEILAAPVFSLFSLALSAVLTAAAFFVSFRLRGRK